MIAYGLALLSIAALGAWGIRHDRATWRQAEEEFRGVRSGRPDSTERVTGGGHHGWHGGKG